MLSNEPNVTRYPIRPEVVARFADGDVLGHINHAKYFTYMEEGRTAYFSQIPELNVIGKTVFKRFVVLATITCDFLVSARIGDVVIVALGVSKIGRKSFVMDYRLFEKTSGRALAKGVSTLVMYDFEKGQSIEIPASLRQRIIEIEQNAPVAAIGQFTN